MSINTLHKGDDDDDDDDNNNNNTVHCTHTSESTNVKVQQIQH